MPAQVNLCNLTQCQVLVVPDPEPAISTEIAAACQLRKIIVPHVDELVNVTYPHFPFAKNYNGAKKEPFCVFHTSGTTGLPKPIVWTHEYVAHYNQWYCALPPEGWENNLLLLSG